MQGLEFRSARLARAVATHALSSSVLLECCGPNDEVIKIMAPLNIDEAIFAEALAVVSCCIRETIEAAEVVSNVRPVKSPCS